MAIAAGSGCFTPSSAGGTDGSSGGGSTTGAEGSTSGTASASSGGSVSVSSTGGSSTGSGGVSTAGLTSAGTTISGTSGSTSGTSGGSTGGSSTGAVDHCADQPCVNGECTSMSGGFVCACDTGWSGDLCDEVAQPFCLRGTLTVTDAFDTVNGNPSTMAFQHLQNVPTAFNLVLDVSSSQVGVNADPSMGPEGQLRTLTATITAFDFDDTFMANTFGAAYVGMDTNAVVLVNGTNLLGLSTGNLVSPTGTEYWGLENDASTVPIAIDDGTGFPMLFPSNGSGSGSVQLRRYQTGTPLMTDYAQATWTVAVMNGSDCD